jgi:hypothetical protein
MSCRLNKSTPRAKELVHALDLVVHEGITITPRAYACNALGLLGHLGHAS